MFKTLINEVKKFLAKGKRIFKSSYKELSWRKKLIKTLMIGTLIVLGLGILVFIAFTAITAYVFGAVASAFGPALENGINEAMGRNRKRRYYY